MATSDLPTDIRTGDPRYELEQPLEHLQTMLNQRNVDVESMDLRGGHHDIMYRGFEPKQLQTMTGIINNNPEQAITSRGVKDLNDMFDKSMINANPNYIFRTDLQTRNNVRTIQTGNQSYARNRDMFVVPPPVDSQHKIFELLSK